MGKRTKETERNREKTKEDKITIIKQYKVHEKWNPYIFLSTKISRRLMSHKQKRVQITLSNFAHLPCIYQKIPPA